jgi:hypothetical protein
MKWFILGLLGLVWCTAPVTVPAALWLLKGAPMGDTSVSPELLEAERKLSDMIDRVPDAAASLPAQADGGISARRAEKARKTRRSARPFAGGEL